jgi:hypothetical protein
MPPIIEEYEAEGAELIVTPDGWKKFRERNIDNGI